MKTFYFFCYFFTVFFSSQLFPTDLTLVNKENFAVRNELILATKFTKFFDQLLIDQFAIEKINILRPKIYIYTDFGGGKNQSQVLMDEQTSGEISSAAWKATLQQFLYINDSAKPLDPLEAAIHLAKTFPYDEKKQNNENAKKISIHMIVVHVVDPGVGNDDKHPQPRSMVLRKDGVLFIGPDNGTLSFVCPAESIAGIWEINSEAITLLSGIDTKVGGTFHGRDLFCEAAFRIAAGIVSPDEIGTPYYNLDLRNRITLIERHQRKLESISRLEFARVQTDRFFFDAKVADLNELFEKAYLLGIIQSSLYQDDQPVALTHSKKLFLPKEEKISFLEEFIAIVNYKTGNIFIGPNNGLGTSFVKDFSYVDFEVFKVTKTVFELIKNESNNEVIFFLLKQQPRFHDSLCIVDFFGSENDLMKDQLGRPKTLKAKIWIDLYGNIKTTASSSVLNEAKQLNASIDVRINGIKKSVSFAETFSQVPKDHLFIYNGSTGSIGPNPHRTKRYLELTSNGVFGNFGIDFFVKEEIKPKAGDIIWLQFTYPDSL